MALSDPQSITISAEAISLPNVSRLGDTSRYHGDGTNTGVDLTLSHAYGKRTRRVIRVDHSKITEDPYINNNNTLVSMSNYMVFDLPVIGYTATEAKAVYEGFKTLFTASSDAVITKLLGGES